MKEGRTEVNVQKQKMHFLFKEELVVEVYSSIEYIQKGKKA